MSTWPGAVIMIKTANNLCLYFTEKDCKKQVKRDRMPTQKIGFFTQQREDQSIGLVHLRVALHKIVLMKRLNYFLIFGKLLLPIREQEFYARDVFLFVF